MGNIGGTRRFWLIVVAILGASAGGCDDGCEEAGRSYDKEAIWTCADGCNTCTCAEGAVTQTDIGCGSPPGPAAGKLKCLEGGFWHTHGDAWDCTDGCSTCGCNDGRVTTDSSACASGGDGSG